MMNAPFSRNYFNQQPSRSAQQLQPRSSPKVVTVPVHFISSEQSKGSAALKIQRVFRGFLVRKNVKKIVSIRNQVGEIQRRINDVEVVELIRTDAKERLRVNETLMSLLFKLDSISGVDCGVRDLRKAVTRMAISLQEKVDSIAQPQADNRELDTPDNDSGEMDCTSTSEEVKETSGFVDKDSGNSEAVEDGGYGDDVKQIVENCNPVEAADGCGAEEGVETSPRADLTEVGKDSVEGSMEVWKDKEGDGKGNRELVKKLMADNEKMMKLMMEISERNELQTRMINSLSRRVEQLEKAFMTDKLRRRKKTNVALRGRDGFCI